uniref:piggyBac transposable element-derived protein 4-like n=1 Tax=Epinephelus lanceolatus TaxID=310571 RepID=UPI001447586A|nr:piggyBac transposable element-derived protein 4-like [Epinephelus lanceolatus]XP_033472354.1 piggyBac transposable element-derived protein 4-like [Epinephelus lanceolatus]
MKRRFSVEEALTAVLQSSEGEEEESSRTDTGSEGTSGEALPEFEEDGFSSSSSCEDMEEEEAAAAWKSRNGQVIWGPTPDETLRYFPPPILTSGPTRYASDRISSPKTSFELFITEEIIQLILKNTNLQGRRTAAEWKDVDVEELWAFIGLLILAGVYRSRDEATQSLWAEDTGRSIFRATMSRKRFQQISVALRFDDCLSRPARQQRDKMAAIRGLWDLWSTRLPLLFNPGRDVCVDEQLVPFRGRCSFRQYIPSKPAKYGLKVWVVCDVETSYAWRMQVYTGRSPGAEREVNQGMRVVLELTEGLEGHTVTMDNFFTSFPLAEELRKRKMTLVGTLRKNKPELPPQLLQTRLREPLSSVFAFTRTQTAVSYVPKRGRNVLLLSTKHREPAVEEGPKKKPKIVTDYNHCKGAVDNLDKVVGTYSSRRRSCRWPQTLFCNILDVSSYNAFILFVAVDPSWNQRKLFRRRLFLEELGKSLVAPMMARRRRMPRTPAAATLVAQIQGQETEPAAAEAGPLKRRKQCTFCTQQRKVWTQCSKCSKYSCKVHMKAICSSCSTE